MKKYFCDITEIDPREFEQWYHEMQPERQEKCGKLKKVTAQKLCIAADHLARISISESLNTKPENIRILTSPSGKPYLMDNPLYFSISHSETMAVCAVSLRSVGIDIEHLRQIKPEIQERICTPPERNFLRDAKNQEEQNKRFFYLWTRKEALFKAKGSIPRKDRETDVLNPPKDWDLSTETIGDYILSIAEGKGI